MAISALFKKLSEVGTYLIQAGEELISGDTGSDGTDGSGGNRRLGQLFKNDEALFTAIQGKNTTLVLGGGTLTWDGSQFSWSADITLLFTSTIGAVSSNVIAASSAVLVDGGYLVAVLDRETDGAAPVVVAHASAAALRSAASSGASRLDLVVLGHRSGTSFYFLDRMVFSPGETGGVHAAPMYAGADLADKLSERVTSFVYGEAILTYANFSGLLSWDDTIYARTGMAAGAMEIPAGSVSIGAGQGAYFTWDYASAGAVVTLSVANLGAIPTDPSVFIFAVRDAVENTFVTLWNGQILSSGSKQRLGHGAGVVSTLNSLTGPVTVDAGAGISIANVSDVTFGGTVTVTNTLDDLVDLNNVTADLEAAILAAKNQLAAVGNPLLTADFVNNIQGFDCMWADGTDTLRISPGILQSGGEWYGEGSGILDVTASNLDTGVISAGNWYYVYVAPDAIPGGDPRAWISATAPTGLSRHPANATWRYIGPVFFSSTTTMASMTKVGGTIRMFDYDITTEISALRAVAITAADLSSVLPATIGSGLVISIELSSSTGTPGRRADIAVTEETGSVRTIFGIVEDDAGGAPYNVNFRRIYFPTGIATPHVIRGLFASSAYGAVNSAYVEEFYEPQFGLRI